MDKRGRTTLTVLTDSRSQRQDIEGPISAAATSAVEVSVVMPCLNEAETLGVCIAKARQALRENRILGEIVVADNGSTDGSQAIATSMGAVVIHVQARGYGNALMAGIAASRGQFIIMGDSDDSYDFLEIPRFVEKLREGFDLVQGCRFPSGGGSVMLGAMPFSHRWLGNPLFSMMARRWFRAPIHDVYCGLRGFTKQLHDQLGQRCTGMEFATEMIIKASIYRKRIAEVPITLHRDGRKSHPPHLRTFRDGWRTLRFFLVYSPRWLFFYPGALLMLAGLLTVLWLLPGSRTIGHVSLDVHTMLYAAMAIVIGFQAATFAAFAKIFAIAEGLVPEDAHLSKLFRIITLEVGLVAGTVLLVAGLASSIFAVSSWGANSFGPLDPFKILRIVIPAVTLCTLGFQIIFASFFMSVLGMRRR